MRNHTKSFAVGPVLLLLCLTLTGCNRSQPGKPTQTQQSQSVIDRVQSEAATILEKEPRQVDVTKPLAELGADELDVVEIIMAVEEVFSVEIPDNAIEEKPGDGGMALTVQKLAEIVSKLPRIQ